MRLVKVTQLMPRHAAPLPITTRFDHDDEEAIVERVVPRRPVIVEPPWDPEAPTLRYHPLTEE